MTGSSRRHAHTGPDAWRVLVAGLATAAAMLVIVNVNAAPEATPALKLKASLMAAGASAGSMTIELFRWSTDAERAPLVAALAAPPPAPPSAAPAPAAGRAGRAGRGGRAAAPPPSPIERLTTAIKAAPTVGFIWGEGPTGYSVKYAWRSSATTPERIVLVTDRRLGANAISSPQASTTDVSAGAVAKADAEFTVVEMRIDGKGVGEARSSPTSSVVVDVVANTIAIDKYSDAPLLLKVTR